VPGGGPGRRAAPGAARGHPRRPGPVPAHRADGRGPWPARDPGPPAPLPGIHPAAPAPGGRRRPGPRPRPPRPPPRHAHPPPFVTAGWRGGGPHALACAAALPGRCLAAASIAGVAPYQADGLDWLAGMGPENVAEFGAALRGEAALTEFLEREAAGLRTVTGEGVAKALGGLVIEADQAVLTGEFADYIAAGLRAATSAGVAGWRDDDLAFTRDWGFPLGQGAPVAVWQGD